MTTGPCLPAPRPQSRALHQGNQAWHADNKSGLNSASSPVLGAIKTPCRLPLGPALPASPRGPAAG